MNRMYASTEVRHCWADGSVVLMNLRTGEYSILNSLASAMWHLLLSGDEDRTVGVASLATKLRMPVQTVEADLQAFSEDCENQGLLAPHLPAGTDDARRAHNVVGQPRLSSLRAWWAIAATVARLRRHGFGRTYRCYARMEKTAEAVDNDRLRTAVERFRMAENFFIFPTAPKDCLPRSLALYRFLLEMGLPAAHCMGVQRFPFEAHAWVECHGEALFNHPDDLAGYSELARI